MEMYSVGDLVLLQGWRVGMIVGVEYGTGYTDWVQVMFPVAGTAWLDAHRLKPLSSNLLP